MSTRDSIEMIKMVNPEGGYAALEHEMMAERASSLATAEKRVASAIEALAAAGDDRAEPLAKAREAVWAYFVQREMCGIRRHQDVITMFKIPREVLNGLGMVGR